MITAPPLVVFAPASGPGVGGGHVMRGLTLAEALARRGARCVFAVKPDGGAILARFAARPVETALTSDEPLPAVLARLQPQVLVLDDYGTTPAEEAALKGGARLVVMDDLADRAHPADLLVDPGHGRLAADYEDLLPPACVRLIGPAYALVRPAFAALRQSALTRPVVDQPRRLFVSFGLSDVEGIAGRAAALVRAVMPDAQIDVALAASAESLPALTQMAAEDGRLRLHVDATDVAALMAEADLALGAGGASTWERACLGLPTLAVVVADNQRAMIGRMAAEGLLLSVDLDAPDFEADFRAALGRLGDMGLRRDLRDRSAALCDGLGAERIAEAVMGLL
jgi:UDP-2,4-diacetamido-2,4,6-trideoxy-beta-L-altropyranose hydrolase